MPTDRPLQFEIEFSDPLEFERTGRRQDDVRAILIWLNGQLEAAIRRDPDQYMWGHRRWREEDAARA